MDLPDAWRGQFDLVFEAYTLQAVPRDFRDRMIPCLPGLLAPGGLLLVVCRGGEEGEATAGPPWRLSREQFAPCLEAGLILQRFDDFMDEEDPPVRRFILEYVRPTHSAVPQISAAVRPAVAVMEGLRARHKEIVAQMVSIEAYERWGNPSPEEMQAALDAAAVQPDERTQVTQMLAAAVAEDRAQGQGAVAAWSQLHIYLLETLLRSAHTDADATSRFVIAQERREWLRLGAGGDTMPGVNSYYVHHDPADYAAVFGPLFGVGDDKA